ncbi:MAG TPA: hypothetical protein PKA63_00560 [Oligoflexia bacterium]|nr:hypothetical protein [Oligoflexia bacterium]HMP47141.1 hypothetical protein [Oligoflexia bacterium]
MKTSLITISSLQNQYSGNFCFVLLSLIFYFSVLLTATSLTTSTLSAESVTESAGETNLQQSESLSPGDYFSCKSDIFYLWTPEIKIINTSEIPQAVSTASSEAGKSEDIKDKTPDNVEYFNSIEERGKDKPSVLLNLNSRIPAAKNEAMAHCRNTRSIGLCKEGKIKAADSKSMLLDFETRRVFLESIKESCEKSAGICKEVTASEAACAIIRSPDTNPTSKSESKKEDTTTQGSKKGK